MPLSCTEALPPQEILLPSGIKSRTVSYTHLERDPEEEELEGEADPGEGVVPGAVVKVLDAKGSFVEKEALIPEDPAADSGGDKMCIRDRPCYYLMYLDGTGREGQKCCGQFCLICME